MAIQGEGASIWHRTVGADGKPGGIKPRLQPRWRQQLLTQLTGVGALFGSIVYVPSVWIAWNLGHMPVVIVDTLAITVVLFIYFFRHLAYAVRAMLFCSILYLLGAMLLIEVGTISQIYLLGFSIITALLLGMRAGLVSMALNGVTLFLAGTVGFAAPEMHVDMLGDHAVAWLIITLNFLLVNTILVVALSAIVGRMERSLVTEQAVRVELLDEGRRLESAYEALQEEMRANLETQEELRRFRSDHEELLAVLQEGVWMTDLDAQKVLYASPAFKVLTGYDPGRLYANKDSYLDVLHEEDAEAFMQGFEARFKGDLDMEARIRHPERGVRWMWLRTTLVPQNEHHGLRLVGVLTDITERKEAELALSDSEERYQLAVEGSGAGLWDWKLSTHCFYVSPRFETMLGYAPGSLDLDWNDLPNMVHPEDAAKVQTAIVEHLEKDVNYEIECRLKKANGTFGWFRARGKTLRDGTGAPLRIAGSLIDVTREHAYVEALEERERRYRLLFEQNPHCMWVYAQDTLRFLAVNEAALLHYGYSRDAFLAMSLLDLLPSEAHRAVLDMTHRRWRPEDRTGIWPHRKADGTVIEAQVTVHETTFQDRTAYLALSIDMTDKLATERALVLSQQRLEEAQQLARIGYWERDLETGGVVWSDILYDIFGVEPEAQDGSFEAFKERVHPEDRAAVEQTVKQALATRSGFKHTYRIVRPNGIGVIFEIGKVRCDQQGFPVRLFGSAQDITDRWRAQEALRVSEERFRDAIDNAPFPAILYNDSGDILAMNKVWTTLTGYGRDRIRTLQDWFHLAYDDSMEAYLERSLQEMRDNRVPRHEGAFAPHMASGEQRIWDFHTTPLEDDVDGRMIVLTMAIDVTEERQATELLKASEERFRIVAQVSNDAIWDWDLLKDNMAWSDGFGKHFGYEDTKSNESWQVWEENIHPDDQADVLQGIEEAIRLGRDFWEHEYRFFHRDGTVKTVDDRGRILRDDSGRAYRMIGGMTDITERKAAEAALNALNAELEERVAQRTEALENANREMEAFTYSVSHDLRAPLRAINGFSRVILEDHGAELPEDARRYFDLMCRSAQQMGQLINDLLTFSRLGKHDLQPEPVDLDEILDEALTTFAEAMKEGNVALERAPLGQTSADPVLVRQVWINLIDNAVKYTRETPAPCIRIGADDAQPDETAYWIRDNGVGFDMRYVHKLFTPFQRLHRAEDYEGTGIGLAIVQRVVSRHGGRVWAESKPGQGAAFFFTLPKGPAA